MNFARTPLASPALAISALAVETGPSLQVRAVELQRVLDTPVYLLHYDLSGERLSRMADARDGTLLPPLDRTQASEIARRDYLADEAVSAVEYLETVPPGDEYRGGPLPAWRVTFDGPDRHSVYVVAETGRVSARRDDGWRLFDLFWMLHILDFESRDNFNTLLLQVLAALAIITVASGFLLWAMTTSLLRSR